MLSKYKERERGGGLKRNKVATKINATIIIIIKK